MKTVIIVGAGASGLACAATLNAAKRNDLKIILLERLNQPGKKILATGNGRCNFSNLAALNHKEVTDFFSSIGVFSRQENARIYPYSLTAQSVQNALIKACEGENVNIITDCTVERITPQLTVIADLCSLHADFVVMAAGGMAQEKLGSDGSGFYMLSQLGHTIREPCPALVQLVTEERNGKHLVGCRARGRITMTVGTKTVGSEKGEVLFTDYGLSGIAIMNLSGYASRNFLRNKPSSCYVSIDLIPMLNEKQIAQHLKKFGTLNGLLSDGLCREMQKRSHGDASKIPTFAKNLRYRIINTKGFSFAQITDGGAVLSEFKKNESTKVKNLYACGEVLNRQFPCGGFNLNNAFFDGIVVARNIIKKIDRENAKKTGEAKK